jgi:hypothetical protein
MDTTMLYDDARADFAGDEGCVEGTGGMIMAGE